MPTSVKGIRLNICDVNWRPPQTMLARKMLTDTVTATQCERTSSIRVDGMRRSISVNTILQVFSFIYAPFFFEQSKQPSISRHRSCGSSNGAKYSYRFKHNPTTNSPDTSLAV